MFFSFQIRVVNPGLPDPVIFYFSGSEQILAPAPPRTRTPTQCCGAGAGTFLVGAGAGVKM